MIMKKREKIMLDVIHRGNSNDLLKKYQQLMDVIHKIPPTYYSQEGRLRRIGSRKSKIS